MSGGARGGLAGPGGEKAELARQRLPELKRLLASCRICPRLCRVRRAQGERGDCELPAGPVVSSAQLHHGEEPVLSGWKGSGTVFFAGCNLACLFCQNYPISQQRLGEEISPARLADLFLDLQRKGAHNINLVTPTPQTVPIVEALASAWEGGLALPVVHNGSGYERVEVLRLLDGLVDVYLTDFKYGGDEAGRLSGVADYASRARAALEEMDRQVGVLELDGDELAARGLMIRHLVLPGGRSESEEVLRWLVEKLGTEHYVSLMAQYHPAWRAGEEEGLDRRPGREEYEAVRHLKLELGFAPGYDQPAPPW